MDSYPVTARTVGRSYGIEGDKLGRNYKEHLSDFNGWNQREHADQWVLQEENVGENMSLDETQLHDDLFTILSNKDGHGGPGTVAAVVSGTSVNDVLPTFMRIPEEKRMAVKEITMDFSESMRAIAKAAFPDATITIDCFHVMKLLSDSLEEMRLKEKRLAVKEVKKLEARHKERIKRNAYHRKWYRKKHPKRKGENRGRKAQRANAKFVPPTFSNGDTRIELLTRSKYLLCKSYDKLSGSQRARAKILFEEYPKLKEVYWIINELRAVFRTKNIDKETAKVKFAEWYKMVADCTSRELKAARDTIKSREDEVLNYFVNRATNASAESLNSKLKGFRSQLRGVSDLQFYMFRVMTLFG